MLDHLLESSHRDNSNKWSNIRFSEEITQTVPTEVYFKHLLYEVKRNSNVFEQIAVLCMLKLAQKAQVEALHRLGVK